MNQKLIVINGKTYKSTDEMPDDIRREYENAMRNLDKNQNGMPDIFENKNSPADQNDAPDALSWLSNFQTTNVIQSTKIIVNGSTYDNVDQLPPELRAKYEKAMGAMDANKNGIPDFAEGMLVSKNQTANIATGFGTTSPPRSQPIPVSSTMEPESSGGWALALTGIGLVGACLLLAAGGVWYYFFR